MLIDRHWILCLLIPKTMEDIRVLRNRQNQEHPLSKESEQKAQSLIEYSIILGVIGLILYTMGPFFQRTIQGMIKVTADQIGTQENGDQQFDEHGHLQESHSKISGSTAKGYREYTGNILYNFTDDTRVESTSLINMGYQENPDR